MVNTPLPLDAFRDTVLEHQCALVGPLPAPIISNIALLTLSRPVSSFMLGDVEILIMLFFGVYWLFDPHTGLTGFFATEREAVEYVRAQL